MKRVSAKAKQMRRKRAKQSKEDKEYEALADRERKREARANESELTRRERLDNQLNYEQQRLASESESDKTERLNQKRRCEQNRRAEESEDNRNNRLQQQQLRTQQNNENESEERRSERLNSKRNYMAHRRQSQRHYITEAEEPQPLNLDSIQPAMQPERENQQQADTLDDTSMLMTAGELFSMLQRCDKNEQNLFFKDIDRSPLKACLLLYLNSGYGRFDQYKEFDANMNATNVDVDGICKEIQDEVLNDKEMYELINTFHKQHSYTEGNLYSCGLCGIRHMEVPNRVSFALKDLNTIPWVHYTEDETEELNNLIETGTVSIPISPTESSDIKPWLVKSFYLSQVYAGRYYHVHPELVEQYDNHEYTRVCPTCNKYPTKKVEKSPLSIANGIDFGSYRRIKEMVEPNLHEQLILSQIRLFQTIVRVSPNNGQRNYLRHNIKANAIMFIHDGPERACEEINNHSFDNYLKLFFVDEEGHADRLAKKVFKTTTILARKYVVKQWLILLNKMNYWYSDYTEEYMQKILDATGNALQSVKRNCGIISDKAVIQHDAALGSDVAAVQQVDPLVYQQNEHEDNEQEDLSAHPDNNTENTTEVSMRYSFVSPNGNAILSNDKLRNRLLFNNVMKMLNRSCKTKRKDDNSDEDTSSDDDDNSTINSNHAVQNDTSVLTDESSVSSLMTETTSTLPTFGSSTTDDGNSQSNINKSYRLNTPVNEFDASDFLLGSSFPHVFVLGYAYDKKMCNLNTTEVNHLLKQFTNIPAKTRRLLGYLQDVKKRFAVIQGVRTQVQGNQKNIDMVKTLLDSAEHQKMFQEAMKEPNGPLAKQILKKLLPLLNITGGAVPYGAVETNVALTKIFEMTKRYGPAFGFLTFSFDDIHNPRAIRAAYNTVNNTSFPAVFTESESHGASGIEFIQNLRNASKVKHTGEIDLPEQQVNPLHLQHNLAAMAMDNPIAYVQESKAMIQHVLELLIGYAPEHFWSLYDGKSIRKTRYFKTRGKGVFGHTLAYFGMIEDHQKGTLHYHFLLYGSLSPYVLHRFANMPTICKEISIALDAMFKAKLPVNNHVSHLIPKVLRDHSGFQLNPKSLGQMTPPPMFQHEYPLQIFSSNTAMANRNTFLPIVCTATNSQAGKQAFHEHYLTCRKGLNGHSGCRLCKPSGSTKITHPVLLKIVQENILNESDIQAQASKYTYEVIDPVPELQNITYCTINPSLSQQQDLIIWEIDRPVPLLHEDEHYSLVELKEHFKQDERKIRNYIKNLFLDWLKDDQAYPETSILWEWLDTTDFEVLCSFYGKIFDRVNSANGYMVDYNPILMYCTRSHHNVSLLGGTEQSNAAMMYISPYVVKGKIELALCLAIMENTRKHIQNFPSTAADAETHVSQRQVQHFLTRCLNKMNSLIELSDYQVAADLLGLPSQLTTDTYIHMGIYGYMAYNTHIQSQQSVEKYRDRLFEQLNDQLDLEENITEIDKQFLALSEHSHTTPNQQDDVSECLSDDSYDSDTEANNPNNNDTSESIPINRFTADEYKTRMQDFLVGFGAVAIYELEESIQGSDPVRTPIPYVACYSHRGEKLKHLNRYEYASLIQIKKKTSDTQNQRSTRFEFCSSFPLQRCYAQYFRAKQKTVIFNGKAPRHPGPTPNPNSTQYQKWNSQADLFARYYLTAFRAEPACFLGHQQNNYCYDWNTFQFWIQALQHDSSVLSKFRLTALYTRLQSLKSTFKNKVIINKYRGRARDTWSDQHKDKYNSDTWLNHLSQHFDNDIIEEMHFQNNHLMLSRHETNQLQLQVEDDTNQASFFDNAILRHRNIVSLSPSHNPRQHQSMIHTMHNDAQIFQHAERIYEHVSLSEIQNPLVLLFDVPHVICVQHEPVATRLNPNQQLVYNVYATYFEDVDNPNKAPPKLGLLTGSAGSGKSHVINNIVNKGLSTRNHVIPTAYNNLNALDVNGPTLAQLTSLQPHHSKHKETLTAGQLEKIRNNYNLQNAKLIIIDEISNVAAHVLARLDDVFKQVTGVYNKMFGGIPVLMVGDMNQKAPVFGKSLPLALLELERYKHESSRLFNPTRNKKKQKASFLNSKQIFAPESPVRIGAELFAQTRWMELTQQQRAANDLEHTAFVHHLYQGGTIDIPTVNSYQELTSCDLESPDSPWLQAPIIVRTNREKVTLNYKRAVQYATQQGKVVIKWKTKFHSWEQKPRSEQDLDIIMQDAAFYEYFVQGAYGYIRDNICKQKKLVNGTRVEYVSLSLSQETEDLLHMQMATSQAGDVIELPEHPVAINVRLLNLDAKQIQAWAHLTLVPNDVVIPLLAKRFNRKTKGKKFPIPGVPGSSLPSRVRILNEYPVELSFAMTVEKSQGQTLDYAIIALGGRRGQKCQFDYASVYVAFSRVREKSQVRLLLKQDNVRAKREALLYLPLLKPNKATKAFFSGFEANPIAWEHRVWDQPIALKNI